MLRNRKSKSNDPILRVLNNLNESEEIDTTEVCPKCGSVLGTDGVCPKCGYSATNESEDLQAKVDEIQEEIDNLKEVSESDDDEISSDEIKDKVATLREELEDIQKVDESEGEEGSLPEETKEQIEKMSEDLDALEDEANKVEESFKRKTRRSRRLSESTRRRRRMHEADEEDTKDECDDPTNEYDEIEEEDTITEGDEEDIEQKQAVVESCGGYRNVHSSIKPSKIRKGDIVLDLDSRTAFKAMTESVSTRNGYKLNAKILKTPTRRSHRLVESVCRATLSKNSNCLLLKRAPRR